MPPLNGSMRITSAPNCAIVMPPSGAATKAENSTIRKSWRSWFIAASWAGRCRPRNRQLARRPGKTVGAPGLAADAMMHEEQPVGVVFLFDLTQPRVVRAPIGILTGRVEKIAFGEIGAARRGEFAEFVDGLGDLGGLLPRGRQIWLVPGKAGIGRRPFAADARQHERVEYLRVHR